MPFTKERKEIQVYHQRGSAMTLKDVEEFCAEARRAGFGDKSKPWAGDGLIHSMSMTRYEEVS